MRTVVVAAVVLAALSQPAASQDTSVGDCNSADTTRILSGCTALIKQAQLKEPMLALAYSRRSDAYVGAGNLDQAIADRAKAAELQPGDALHKQRLSLTYQLRAADHYKNKREAKAFADYAEAIRIDANNHSAFAARSNIYLANQNFDKAISDLETATKLEPSIETYRLWLANLYEHRGIEHQQKREFDGTIKDYTSAIKAIPTNATYFERRAEAYVSTSAKENAIMDLSDAIRLNPKSVPLYVRQAELYLDGKDSVHALSSLDGALAQDAKNVPTLLLRALVYEGMTQGEKALADYQAVLKIDESNDAARKGIKRLSS